MSQAELERFATAALNEPALAERHAAAANLAELAARLRADGYDVTDAEVADAHRRSVELPDEMLDQVSGGAGVLLGLGGLALVGGLVFGAVVAADGINNLVTGRPAVINDALRNFASKLYPH
ncbi:Nif11-like leader peptide family RiPP precursor [Azospirillum agricola]|uniref:Nif11-like leader peptide family RiPP precursor n=1 Tax=Azospirillum agricola TaxID=1720247 RepID=UPI000A0F1E46|nr:Nif11-like leader peptide family RiPP precursor [Azospirillum agricola]MBP2230954.1 putative ribosomally synthesized peptide with nif11-like leader [Azospirillum agricola]SMH28676.1 nif11-like leader peptide domain-containing protein [Azospirillum lipoferum]